jgi:hypothetical protein
LVVLVVHVVGPEAVVKVRHINDVGYWPMIIDCESLSRRLGLTWCDE